MTENTPAPENSPAAPSPDEPVQAPAADGDDTGDPTATDTGDFAEVPENQRGDVDTVEPNDDAGDSLDDVEDGQVVDLNAPE